MIREIVMICVFMEAGAFVPAPYEEIQSEQQADLESAPLKSI